VLLSGPATAAHSQQGLLTLVKRGLRSSQAAGAPVFMHTHTHIFIRLFAYAYLSAHTYLNSYSHMPI